MLGSGTLLPLALMVGGTAYLTIGTIGNVTVNAPSSGTMLNLGTSGNSGEYSGSNIGTIALGSVGGLEGDTVATNLTYNVFYNGSAANFQSRIANNVASYLRQDTNGFTFNVWNVTTSPAGSTVAPHAAANINPAGNVTVNAPSSGVALYVNQGANTAIQVATSTGQNAFFASDGTVNSGWFSNGASGVNIGTSTAHACTLTTNSTGRLGISSAGNVSINAPSSGTALYTTGVALGSTAGNATLVTNFNYSSANNDQLQVVGYRDTTGTAWTSASTRLQKVVDATQQGYIYFGDGGRSTAAGLQGLILGSTGHDAVYIGQSGNVTVAAPTSGTALTVTGVAGQNALSVVGGNTSTNTSTMYLGDPSSTRGSEIQFASSTASSTAKYLRNNNGQLQVINSAYTATLFAVDDSGNATALTSMSSPVFNTTSDRNVKTNITPITDSASIINSLTGVRFNWKTDNTPSAGLIAQDVEAVMPELIRESEAGIKSINYAGIIGALVEAVKELTERVKQLEGN